jgi:hypothetical protein
VALFCLLALSACPRFAYVELHNLSGQSVEIFSSGARIGSLSPAESVRFRVTSREVEIASENIRWTYALSIPHGGENGPFFNGVLRLQLRSSGELFALRVNPARQGNVDLDQPEGFPLVPLRSNQALQPASLPPFGIVKSPAEFGRWTT